MKKLVTKINDEAEDIFISKNTVTLKNKNFSVAFQNGSPIISDPNEKSILIDDVIDLGDNIVRIEIEGYTIDVTLEDPLLVAVSRSEEFDLNVISPLAGSVSNIQVRHGDLVKKGDVILVISAMKMENKIIAKSAGRVKSINVSVGDQVNKGAVLIEFEK